MRKLTLIVMMFMVGFAFMTVSCEKKKEDPKAMLVNLFNDGKYREAKQQVIALRFNYPNDPELTDYAKKIDAKLAQEFYDKYWAEAETAGNYKGWVTAMIKAQKVENINKDMLKDWKKKAAVEAVAAAAKEDKDGMLLAHLKQLNIRYQVLSYNDRLTYITQFVKEGRFPMSEWKDTFTKEYSELMDAETGEFVGYPKPEKAEKPAEAKK